MISDRSDYRIQIRRLCVTTMRISYQWICNHPFLLGFFGFLYFLHRTCPLLFYPLVSASPVLVCTLVLLGTILSFGEPHIPEIEKEPETVHEAALFRTEVSRDATVVEKGDKSFAVERFVSTEKDVLEDGNSDAERLKENQFSEVEEDGRSFDYKPLVDETLDEVKRDTHVRFEEKAFDFELEKRGERLEHKLTEDDGMQASDAEHSRIKGGMLDISKEDQMDLSPVSPWRPMRHEEDDNDDGDRDDSLDSGSDGAESSSPDASMTDIIPMLDELHPLLHLEAPTRGVAEGSDAASAGSHRSSSDEGMESDVDSGSHGDEGENENEVEEEEQEKKEDKDDESKSAIKWTEADQKNVMDLGSLELERNQRLENLIARRRARHNMRLMAERNLIDFDSADIPFNMPSISTARQNPFDLPYDSYDDMGLPPIPGSAPSIMFARRNPFDLPYEPNEEKPDLKGDAFQDEFSSQQQKDPVFRRHESFSVGPSTLGGPRHDRLRPFFMLERLANEGTSYSPLERQLSEISESKVSSVPDTESVCTILEDDEKKVDERDADRETKITKVDMASDHDEEKSHSGSDHDEEKSHSTSEDSDSDGQADSKNLHHGVSEIVLGSAETHYEQSNMMEGEASNKGKLDEDDSRDSDSSLSDKEEKISDFSENESMLISDRKIDLHEESGTSSQPSFGDLDIHVARGVEDDYHHDESHAKGSLTIAHPLLEESANHDLCGSVNDHHEPPVYDSSPPSRSRFSSFSSVLSDDKADLPEKNVEEVQENVDKESEVHSEGICPGEIHSSSDESEIRTREVGETSTNVTGEASSQTFNADIPIDSYSTLSSGAVEYVETHSFNEDVSHLEQDPVQSLASDTEEETLPNRTMDIEVDSVNANSQNMGSEDATPSNSTRELTWSDKSVVEQSSLEAGEDQVPTRAGPVSVVFSRNITFHEYHDAPEDEAELACLTSDTSSSPAESPEYTTPMVGGGSRVEYFQEGVYEDLDHVAERLDQLTDLHTTSQSLPEVITEEADEIKEIDEGLLSELDTIGDFSFKEVVTDSEPGPSSVGSDTANELTKALPVLEARSDEDREFQQIHEGSEVDDVVLPSTVQDQLSVKEVVTDSEPGPSSIGSDTTNELTKDLPVLEERSVEDIGSAFQQTHEGSEVDDVILPSTVEDQLSQENDKNSTETESHLAVADAASTEDLDTAVKQAVVESMDKQPETPESDGGSGEINSAVETEPSESLVEERSLDETNVPLNNTPDKEKEEEEESSSKEKGTSDVSSVVEERSLDETKVPLNNTPNKEEEEESRSKEEETTSDVPSLVEERSLDETNVPLNNTPDKEEGEEEEEEEEESRSKEEETTSDVSSIETRSLEEIPKPSEPTEGMAVEVISETVVIPTESTGSSNVTPSDQVVTEEAKAETARNTDSKETPELKETPENSGESIAGKKL